MIKDLRENDLGFMVGTFYSSIFKYDIEATVYKGLQTV